MFFSFSAFSLFLFLFLSSRPICRFQWREKVVLGITTCITFIAYAVLTFLLWPSRSERYFTKIKTVTPDTNYEQL
jgi:hypothetical protein